MLEVDLTDGTPAVVSDNAIPDANNAFATLCALALDSANNQVLATDTDLKAVFAIDLVNGQRVLLSR